MRLVTGDGFQPGQVRVRRQKPARIGLFRRELGGVRGFYPVDARARSTHQVALPACRQVCSFAPAQSKKSLYVNKAAKTTLYSHKGSF